jgi:heterodisulfide reductase subunit D
MAECLAAGEVPEILFWVGCAGSFDDRAKKKSPRLLQEFSIIAMCHSPYLAVKNLAPVILPNAQEMNFSFKMMAMQNIQVLNGYEVKKKL